LQSSVDIFFYRKPLVVPWNIVAYNVFGGSGKGPNIYGTEAWHYYLRNLGLNFNIWLFLALGAGPLLLFQHFVRKQPASRQSFVRNLTFISPFYLWLTIFSLQPHKEERFMYPAYPLLALNAAMSLHIVLGYVGTKDPKVFFSKIPASLRLAAVVFVVIGAIDLGLLRIVGMITAYSAPLKVYAPLQDTGVTRFGDNLCLGKEWYRFPSSFFLPDGMHAKFIKSEFSGLLPGEFSEANFGFGFYPGAWLEPSGMNDENKEDFGKYVSLMINKQTATLLHSTDRHRPMQFPGGFIFSRLNAIRQRARLRSRHRSLGTPQMRAIPRSRQNWHSGSSILDPRLVYYPRKPPSEMGQILSLASQNEYVV
jgi:alpha-1,2-mannosyltransferase